MKSQNINNVNFHMIGRNGISSLKKITLSKALGFLLGMPFALNNSPLYLIALFVFSIALLRRPFKVVPFYSLRIICIYSLILLGFISNLIAISSINIDSFRMVSTSMFFILLFFGEMVENKKEFLDGFLKIMVIWAVYIILLAMYLEVYKYGLLLFSVPDYRMWGVDLIPDWPNYMAFMLSFSLMLNIFVFKRWFITVVLLIAIVFTTSRTPFLAIGLILGYFIFFSTSINTTKRILIYITSITSIVLFLVYITEYAPDFLERLIIFEDRQQIYSYSFDLLSKSPFIGHGSILLDSSVGFEGFPSFHNTYFDISVRHGLPALILFLYVLMPNSQNSRLGGKPFVATILFFLIGAVFQNFLKHPHIIMLYMVLINSGYIFSNDASGN